MLFIFYYFLALDAALGYPQLLGTNGNYHVQRPNQHYSPWHQNVMPYFQYPSNWNNYGMMMPPNNYKMNQFNGCSTDAGCASACLRNPFYPAYDWQYSQLVPSPNDLPDAESSTTAKPGLPEFTGCEYSGCSLGNYGPSCGLRAGYNLCGATNGWPTSYCGNDWNYTPYCDTDLCTRDCQSFGQNGGFCQQDKCLCFKQTFKSSSEPVSEESNAP